VARALMRLCLQMDGIRCEARAGDFAVVGRCRIPVLHLSARGRGRRVAGCLRVPRRPPGSSSLTSGIRPPGALGQAHQSARQPQRSPR
jgi:hypothetical protein